MKRLLTSPLLRPVSILLGLTLLLAYWELARQLPGALWWRSLFTPILMTSAKQWCISAGCPAWRSPCWPGRRLGWRAP